MLNNTIIKYTLYKHIFPNGKIYIGITCQDPIIRWRKDGSGYKNNPLMWKAIQKYGWENITHEICYTNLSEDEANNLEQALVKEYNSTDPKFGYNIRPGGLVVSGWHHTEETIKKLAEIQTGHKMPSGYQPWNKGIHYGKKIIYQYSLEGDLLNTFNGYWEASQKLHIPEGGISDSANGLCKTYYGFTFSKEPLTKEEVLTKIKSEQGAHKITIYQYDRDGNFIDSYISYKAVINKFNIAESVLQNCLSGKNKTSKGFVFSKTKLTKEEVLEHYKTKKRKYKYKITVIDKTTNKKTVFYNIEELASFFNIKTTVMRNIINGAGSKLKNNYIFIKELNNEN